MWRNRSITVNKCWMKHNPKQGTTTSYYDVYCRKRNAKRAGEIESYGGKYNKVEVENKWLELGDANIAYFFANLKNRQAHNRIKSLINDNGQILQQADDIEREVTSFYKKLFGSDVPRYQLLILT